MSITDDYGSGGAGNYGRDCPPGKVQVEFVGVDPSLRMSNYGWAPSASAFLALWVDGRRFRVDVGTFRDNTGERRGLHIITEAVMDFRQTALNACSIVLTETVVQRMPDVVPMLAPPVRRGIKMGGDI